MQVLDFTLINYVSYYCAFNCGHLLTKVPSGWSVSTLFRLLDSVNGRAGPSEFESRPQRPRLPGNCDHNDLCMSCFYNCAAVSLFVPHLLQGRGYTVHYVAIHTIVKVKG